MIKPESKFQEDYLKSDARVMVVGGAMGCLPASTEYLSKTGWKSIADYDGGQVAEVALDSKDKTFASVQFKQPKEFIKIPCGSMRKLQGSRFSLEASEEHRVVYWNDKPGAYKVLPFSQVIERHASSETKGWTGKIKTAFSDVSGTTGIPLTEGELRLQVIAMADGYFPKEGKDNYCQVFFSKERKIQRFLKIVEKFNMKYKDFGYKEDARYSSGRTRKFVFWPKLKEKKYSSLFWSATKEQLDIIADEAPHWDGSVKGDTRVFYSKHKSDADFMQYAFSSQNQTSTIVEDKREKTCWTVNTSPHGAGFRSFANKDGKCPVVERPTEDGYKYCFETSTGFFLIRENGRISVTGNSSKTFVGLLRHARFIEDPNYIGYVIRKNSTMLMATGGVFDEAYSLYKEIEPGCVAKTRDKKIVFPSGAVVAFNHYENTQAGEDLYRGLQVTNFMYDESSQAMEEHIWFLLSRMRSRADYPGSMWLTCNPDPDSYLAKWIDWYLIPKKDKDGKPNELAGRPDPEKNGVIRYMLRNGGNVVWGETAEELIEKYRSPNPDAPLPRPISFQGLFGNIYDNPPLIRMNPDYLSNLEALPRVEKERNLHGNWYARQEASGHFKRQWMLETHEEPAKSDIARTVRAWDLAGELKSELNPDPDYLASVKMSLLKNGMYFIHEVTRQRARFGDWVGIIVAKAEQDGRHVDVIIPQDPNASAKAAAKMMANQIIAHGFVVKLKPSNRSKMDRYRPYAASAKLGNVMILEGCASDEENKIYNDNGFYYTEQEKFNGDNKGHDDMVDATGDAFTELAGRLIVPTFSIPSFSKSNEFSRKITG